MWRCGIAAVELDNLVEHKHETYVDKSFHFGPKLCPTTQHFLMRQFETRMFKKDIFSVIPDAKQEQPAAG